VNFTWPDHDLTVTWPWSDCDMTITWPLSDSYLTVIWPWPSLAYPRITFPTLT
jgi:hypothetical protein